jgi:ABC-type bacteriocin/lantibiotic exporter with double-glycine peptidase domain
VYAVRVSYYRFKFAIKLMNNLMNHFAPLTVLMAGGYLAINGETTVGTIVAFISGFERMADPSRELLAYYHLASESQAQYRLIEQHVAD